MDPDSGNALSAVTVRHGGEKTRKDVEVDLEKAELDISRPGSPASTTDGGLPLETSTRSSDSNALPFSKARLIGLVITLTGAAFLNVSTSSDMFTEYTINSNRRHLVFKPL
jgi:hypothetical protein